MATEIRAQRNYAGHRLAPWLGHLMVSRQETARALLTPGEVMQLPPAQSVVMLSGHPPIRAQKLRYFEDANFTKRVCRAPALAPDAYIDAPPPRPDDWTDLIAPAIRTGLSSECAPDADADGGGPLRQWTLAQPAQDPASDLNLLDDDQDASCSAHQPNLSANRQTWTALPDPDDGIIL